MGATVKASVLSITLERAEGPIAECGQSKVVSSFDHADAVLWGWAATAPKRGGGYDKCDFLVNFSNGDTYQGRFDLQYEDRFKRRLLQDQISHHLAFMAGTGKPSHMTEEDYVDFLAHAQEFRAEAMALLENVNLT